MNPGRAKAKIEGHSAVRLIVALAAVLGGIVAVFELLKVLKGQ